MTEVVSLTDTSESSPVRAVRMEDLMRRSRFKGLKYKLPHTKHTIMAGTFLTHQIDEQAVSNLLKISSSSRKLHAGDFVMRPQCGTLKFSRVQSRKREHDYLRFRTSSKQREEMRQRHCYTIVSTMKLEGRQTTPLNTLTKNGAWSLDNRTRSPTEPCRNNRYQQNLQEIKHSLFEIPLPKDYQVLPSQSFYYPHRHKTLEDYSEELELVVRPGNCPRTPDLDNLDAMLRCPENTRYSNEFYPRRNTATCMKFHKRPPNPTVEKRKLRERIDCIQLGVTEMKLYEKERPEKLDGYSRKLRISKDFPGKRHRSTSIAPNNTSVVRLTRQHTDRYLSPWLNPHEEMVDF